MVKSARARRISGVLLSKFLLFDPSFWWIFDFFSVSFAVFDFFGSLPLLFFKKIQLFQRLLMKKMSNTMTMFAGFFALILSIVLQGVDARLAGECAMQCNDLRLEVLTLEICRDAKKTLPKPKVGDYCSNAMEQGFSDACNAICMDEKPVARLAQACRSAAVEMPRPTVRRWCEHGYRTAFEKTV